MREKGRGLRQSQMQEDMEFARKAQRALDEKEVSQIFPPVALCLSAVLPCLPATPSPPVLTPSVQEKRLEELRKLAEKMKARERYGQVGRSSMLASSDADAGAWGETRRQGERG